MSSYNKVVLMGRVTRDPEVINGQCIITLAVDRPYMKDQGMKETDFIPVICPEKVMEYAINYVVTGNSILIDGKLIISTVQDVDKVNFETLIVAEAIQKLGR